MNDWKQVEIGGIVNFKRGHDLPVNNFIEGQFPVYGSSGLLGYHNVKTTNGPGVVIGRSGNSVGRAHYSPVDFWAHNTTLYVEKFKNSYPKFIYYLMVYLKLGKYEGGSAVPTLNRNNIHNITIDVPSTVQEQKEIADILSNLDKKITLLRKQNQDLEELTQTLFKRWFVEFEFPNTNGEPYLSSGGKMIESELGKIPEGWTIGDVSNHVTHSTESINPGDNPETKFNHYSIPAFDNGRYPTIDLGETILSNKYKVLENSILVSKLNPSTSRIWPVISLKENAICSTEIQVFIPNMNSYAFAFGLFHYGGVKREMAQRASGTSSSHQRVRPGDILNIECINPKKEVLQLFEESVFKIIKKVEDNQEEIQTLTQLRDTLLPKLMSGELRVTKQERNN